MAEFVEIDLSSDDENASWHFRDIYNPLTDPTIDDVQLYKRFRFNRAAINWLTDQLRTDIEHQTGRSRAIPAEIQLLATLRYLASNSYQQVIGDSLNIDQSTVRQERVIYHTSVIIKVLRRKVH